MPSLLDIPNVVMNLISEKLDYKSVQNLRKTCRQLLEHLNNSNPQSKLKFIHISVESDSVGLTLSADGEEWTKIIYEKQENGKCLLQWDNFEKETILENSNFSDVALRDIEIAMDSKKLGILNKFELDLNFWHDNGFPEKLRNNLSRRCQVKTKIFYIFFQSLDQVQGFLPLIDPYHLEELDFYAQPFGGQRFFDLSEIIKIEHWKRAKRLHLNYFRTEISLENLLHFENVMLQVEKVSADTIMILKEKFLDLSHLQRYAYYFDKVFSDNQKLIDRFGDPHLKYKDSEWIFGVKNSDKVITLFLGPHVFHFERMDKEKIPKNVKIL